MVCTTNLIANHQRLAAVPEIEVPQTVETEECHEMVRTKKYIGPNKRPYQIKIGTTHIFTFFTAGHEEVNKNTIICEGEAVKI